MSRGTSILAGINSGPARVVKLLRVQLKGKKSGGTFCL